MRRRSTASAVLENHACHHATGGEADDRVFFAFCAAAAAAHRVE
jgi:hypothetical protein